ncbi:MAG TPA: hypothetical protein ENH85_09820 [Candidatus Scalindua sp.]|nr:hypothetical protein [Candidatus Scalindua sp.]
MKPIITNISFKCHKSRGFRHFIGVIELEKKDRLQMRFSIDLQNKHMLARLLNYQKRYKNTGFDCKPNEQAEDIPIKEILIPAETVESVFSFNSKETNMCPGHTPKERAKKKKKK